jgi:hypothetical protein
MANILFEVSPLNSSTPVTLRMAFGTPDPSGVQLNGYSWQPIIIERSARTISLSDDGLLSEIQSDYGTLSFWLHPDFNNEVWSSYEWTGALGRIFVGTLGDPFSSYVQTFEGSVSDMERDGAKATVTLLGPEAALDKPLLTATYAGTGNAEGPTSLKGALKPRAFGNCLCVDPVLVDPANWIYQVHGYGAVASIIPYEFAQALDPAKKKADSANYAALAALTLLPGEWGTCLAEGLFRLGGTPAKEVSADLTFSGSQTIATIVPQLLGVAGVPGGKIGSFSAFSSVGWNHYQTEQITVGEVARAALRHAGGYLIADGTGVWKCGNYFAPKAPVTLNADRSTTPLIRHVKSPKAAEPVWKVSVGYDRCWNLHSASDVSPAIAEISDATEAAQDAADAAQTTANSASANATTALSRLASIANDNVLDRVDKVWIANEFARLTAEKSGINSTATGLSITTENTAYNTAYSTLNGYLTGLSPSYTDTTTDTAITRSTFDTNWNGLYAARQTVLNKIAEISATKAVYANVSGTPTNLAAINGTEGAKLTSIEAGATVGDNRIRNADLATNATDWTTQSGTWARTTSSTVGDIPAFMRGSTHAAVVKLNNLEKISFRPGARLHFSYSARSEIQSAASGANLRQVYMRLTFYNAANGGEGTFNASDTSKAITNGATGGTDSLWELHTASILPPANAVSVEVGFIIILGTSGSGQFVDVARPVMGVAQAGADRTVDQLAVQQIESKATAADNMIRNASLEGSAANWMISNATWTAHSTVWSSASSGGVPGYLRYTGAATANAYANVRFDRITPIADVNDLPTVVAGKDYFLGLLMRTDGARRLTASVVWYDDALLSKGTSTFIDSTQDTAGAWVSLGGKATAPAGASRVSIRIGFVTPSAGTYTDAAMFRFAASEAGATIGSCAGTNLFRTDGVTVMTQADVRTTEGIASGFIGQGALSTLSVVDLATGFVTNKSLANLDGTAATKLSGIATGATVGADWSSNLANKPTTLAGINSTEATKLSGIAAGATVGADWSANLANKPSTLAGINSTEGSKLAGIETLADVTMLLTGTPTVNVAADYTGAVKSGELPLNVAFKLVRGTGTDVTTSAAWTATLKSGSATASIGSATGVLEITDLGATSEFEIIAVYSGVTRKFSLVANLNLDAAPTTGGGGGGAGGSASDASILGTSSTSYGTANSDTLSVVAGGAGTVTLTAPLNFKLQATLGTCHMYGKWQWRAVSGSWADVSAEILSSVEADSYNEPPVIRAPGYIAVNQSKTGLTSGTTYEFQLLLRMTSAGGNLTVTTPSGASAVGS